jgi:1,4-dihydroxy-6-naphthoate synthase
VRASLLDIDLLNQTALTGGADVIKVSFHAFAHLREHYALLHSGGAMGRGVGPLVVARKDSTLRPASSASRVAGLADALSRVRVAIPGRLTTAALLAGLLMGGLGNTVVMAFDRIMPAVAAGEVDAGVIIHEGRFTFGSYGLRRLLDLGEWWEATTALPLPLGAIAVSRALPREVQEAVERAVWASVAAAQSHPLDSREYVAANAQEMDPTVCQSHIDLYVNEYTLDYGADGAEAIKHLLGSAGEIGVVPPTTRGIFWDDAAH